MSRSAPTSELGQRLWLCGSFAAGIAFFFALTMVPFVALTAMGAVSWLPDDLGQPLAEALVLVFPPQAGLDAEAISHWVVSARGSGWLAAGVGFAVWTTFQFMLSCLGALGYLASGQLPGWRKGLLAVVTAIPLVLVWMLTVLAASFGLLISPAVSESLAGLGLGALLEQAVPALPGLAMLVVALALTYRLAPGVEARWPRLTTAAVLAAGGWLVVGWGFTRLVPALWQDRDLYGALASFLLFMMWCYCNAWVLLLGGLLAASGPRRR